MRLVNETALKPALLGNRLVARFFYSWHNAFVLDLEKTYGPTLEQDLDISEYTAILLHGLNERIIRETTIQINGQTHRALNKRSIFSILQNIETVAMFNVPISPYPLGMVISCGKDHEDALELPSLPVIFKQHIQFEYIPIEPALIHMDYNPRTKDLALTIEYKPDSSITTMMHYGEAHAAQLQSF